MGALSDEGELWTWGKNDSGCLGRPGAMEDIGEPEFTPIPGRMETMREYGVGPIISFACGFKTTVVATAPYTPLPPHKVRERARLDLAREKQSEALYEKAHADVRVLLCGVFVLVSRALFATCTSAIDAAPFSVLNRPGRTVPKSKHGRVRCN